MTRPRKCRNCGDAFAPQRARQAVCSTDCAIVLALRQRAKDEARADRARLAELKPLRDLLNEAQRAFNAYIRERDARLPCVSCGRFHVGKYDAGHYMTSKARPELRFDESNVHKQCVPCNKHLSGNLVAFRKTLERRIGLAELARLEGPQAPHKWTRAEALSIKRTYTAKRRELKGKR